MFRLLVLFLHHEVVGPFVEVDEQEMRRVTEKLSDAREYAEDQLVCPGVSI